LRDPSARPPDMDAHGENRIRVRAKPDVFEYNETASTRAPPTLGYRSPIEFKKLVSTEPATVHDLCAWGGSDRLDVLGPGLKSLSHLRFIFRAIVDPRDASTVIVHVI
jgi:hypothetical protein